MVGSRFISPLNHAPLLIVKHLFVTFWTAPTLFTRNTNNSSDEKRELVIDKSQLMTESYWLQAYNPLYFPS
jgi:hypothetical protein